MRAFIAGVVAAAAIAVVAFVVLDAQQRDTGQSYASQNTRLPGTD
jgi:hypothetical protein